MTRNTVSYTHLDVYKRQVLATGACMVGGSALIVLACFAVPSPALKVAGLLAAGGGLGSLILMWAEFYGSLNPMRVALYHALSLIHICAKLRSRLEAPPRFTTERHWNFPM